MSQREKRKAASRQAIVASAAGLLRERGSGGTSVHAAMVGAGLTVGTFYTHFTDKSALLDEAYRVAVDDALRLVGAASGGCTGVPAVQAVLARYLSEEHRDEPRSGCPLPATLGEGAVGAGSASPAVVVAVVEAMRAEIARSCGQSDDEALALLSLMVGGQILARALAGQSLSGEVLAACRRVGGSLAGAGPPTCRSSPPSGWPRTPSR